MPHAYILTLIPFYRRVTAPNMDADACAFEAGST